MGVFAGPSQICRAHHPATLLDSTVALGAAHAVAVQPLLRPSRCPAGSGAAWGCLTCDRRAARVISDRTTGSSEGGAMAAPQQPHRGKSRSQFSMLSTDTTSTP